jgi:hypothetical protein
MAAKLVSAGRNADFVKDELAILVPGNFKSLWSAAKPCHLVGEKPLSVLQPSGGTLLRICPRFTHGWYDIKHANGKWLMFVQHMAFSTAKHVVKYQHSGPWHSMLCVSAALDHDRSCRDPESHYRARE